MKQLAVVIVALFVILWTPMTMSAGQEQLRIFIRAGEKTHGPAGNDEHDYPAFMEDWTALLNARGASARGALRFPTAEELGATDVLVIHTGDGGTCNVAERGLLETFTRRGGGLVVLHDGMCSDDAAWFAGVAGAAKQHGERNWSRGVLKMQVADSAHPVTKGLPAFEFNDEAFFLLRKSPGMHVLMTTVVPENGEVTPQAWVYEQAAAGGKPYRAFVSMQAHYYKNFSHSTYRELILRGIAWAGRRDVASLGK